MLVVANDLVPKVRAPPGLGLSDYLYRRLLLLLELGLLLDLLGLHRLLLLGLDELPVSELLLLLLLLLLRLLLLGKAPHEHLVLQLLLLDELVLVVNRLLKRVLLLLEELLLLGLLGEGGELN
jgi:hypothetical protein